MFRQNVSIIFLLGNCQRLRNNGRKLGWFRPAHVRCRGIRGKGRGQTLTGRWQFVLDLSIWKCAQAPKVRKQKGASRILRPISLFRRGFLLGMLFPEFRIGIGKFRLKLTESGFYDWSGFTAGQSFDDARQVSDGTSNKSGKGG